MIAALRALFRPTPDRSPLPDGSSTQAAIDAARMVERNLDAFQDRRRAEQEQADAVTERLYLPIPAPREPSARERMEQNRRRVEVPPPPMPEEVEA